MGKLVLKSAPIDIVKCLLLFGSTYYILSVINEAACEVLNEQGSIRKKKLNKPRDLVKQPSSDSY